MSQETSVMTEYRVDGPDGEVCFTTYTPPLSPHMCVISLSGAIRISDFVSEETVRAMLGVFLALGYPVKVKVL